MNRKLVFCIVAVWIISVLRMGVAFPNGGITVRSSVLGTGNPVFRDMPDVKLISEKLFMKLNYEYTDVKVNYILWNDSDEDYVDLDYGFPIDYAGRENSIDDRNEIRAQNIQFTLDGRPLEFKSTPEKVHNKEREVCRKWCFTNLSLPNHSFITLEVSYSVLNGYIEEGFSPLMLHDFEGKGAFLTYDFSPASHWGDGIIRDFYVEVDATDIRLSGKQEYHPYYELRYMREEEFGFSDDIIQKGIACEGLELKQEGNLFTYRARNFDLKKAAPLYLFHGYSPKLSTVLSKKVSPDKYKLSGFSETAQYPISHLSDMNLETAWVVPQGGIGESIEITLKEKKQILSGITIVNGYMKNEKTYTENNRLKKIRIQIKEKKKEEYSEGYDIDFPDTPYETIYFENLIHTLGWIDFFDYYSSEIHENYYQGDDQYDNYPESYKITILEVYPGTKYNDTCISELLLFD